jgi:predicted choloylglycine hydrolase
VPVDHRVRKNATVQAQITFRAVEQLVPDERWRSLFGRHWPRYRDWFLSDGEVARSSYAESARALREHMPELVPTYERLCELAGSGDLEARFLAMWAPPSYLTGCSQAVWLRGAPVLVRNYDYAPERLEGVIVRTHWVRDVIGTSDCAWGLLDGMNDAGVAVSLAFGGRKVVGSGFGVPLVVRYLLETCATTADARAALGRLPYHLAHTLTIVDATGDVCTAYLSPDRGAELSPRAVATNHQGQVEWAEHASATRSMEREECLVELLETAQSVDDLVGAFLRPPLHGSDYTRRMGTLYTCAYDVHTGRVGYRWPGLAWDQSFASFVEGERIVELAAASAA